MTVLDIQNLTVQFGGLKAVNGLNLQVKMGPNGAGKSTTLDLICGKTRATSGKIMFDGTDITDLAEYRRARKGIGRKFQVPSVFKDLTVIENIEIARSRRPGLWAALSTFCTPIRGRVKEVLDRVSLIDQIDTKAGNLSHGQTQCPAKRPGWPRSTRCCWPRTAS